MRSVQRNSISRYLCSLGILVTWVLFASSPSMLSGAGALSKTGATPASSQPGPAARARAVASYGKLPLSFEANQGQTDAQVKFLSRGSGYTLFLTDNEAVLALRKAAGGKQKSAGNLGSPQRQPDIAQRGSARPSSVVAPPSASVLRMRLVGANPAAKVSGLNELPGTSNYFIGNDPKKWRTDVPNYAKVKYESVYPGVDLVYYGNQRQLEYDFVVAPGADPSAIRLNVGAKLSSAKGAQRRARLRIDPNGDLVASVAGEEVRFHKPVVYQSAAAPVSSSASAGPSTLQSIATKASESRRYLDGRYVLQAGNQVRFHIGAYDKTEPLVIDPVLTYSSLIGSGGDSGSGIAVDGSGNVYLTGVVNRGGNFDAFATKINAAGTALVYSIYLGGSYYDGGASIAVDSLGNAYLTGATESPDFPRVNQIPGACQGTCGTGHYFAVFVTKINAAGNALVYSSLIGGSHDDSGSSIAVDSSGNAYLTGASSSYRLYHDFPLVNQIPGACNGACQVFVTKVNETGSALVYSSVIGGNGGADVGYGIAVDGVGNAYLTGYTNYGIDFVRVNQISGACNAPNEDCEVFVTKVNGAGSALVYSSLIGGSGRDAGYGIAVDSSGNAYLTGGTTSSDFPRVNQIPGACNGSCGTGSSFDSFVTKINSGGDALVYSSYVGGSGDESGYGYPGAAGSIAVDVLGNAYVTGYTESTDFPIVNQIPGACQGSCGVGEFFDVFLTKINAAGDALFYSSLIGGSGGAVGRGIALDGSGNGLSHGVGCGRLPGGEPDPGRLPWRLWQRGQHRYLRSENFSRRHGGWPVSYQTGLRSPGS